ncbi:MAG: hypothetical protein AUH30_07295 [Candidatus Rokubacteria bacterium 13_1_40CM_68_15]|nr:MAG: hypothetical protein AUH30_07295 [Candidatus Rokubacteria bacterium 13_1_40CM_68_15]
MLTGSHRLRIQHKVWLHAGSRFALGDGGVRLLRAIGTTGSVRAAADHVGWSYRHTLAYLVNAERAFGYRLVQRERGGHERGGARLTPEARAFLARYTRFRQRLQREIQHLYRRQFQRET